MAKNYSWRRYDRNIQLEAEDGSFHISYNPDASSGVSMWAPDDLGAETAVVVDDYFFILNGDWRKQYEPLVEKGLDACLEFFAAHLEHASSWSDDLPQKYLLKQGARK